MVKYTDRPAKVVCHDLSQTIQVLSPVMGFFTLLLWVGLSTGALTSRAPRPVDSKTYDYVSAADPIIIHVTNIHAQIIVGGGTAGNALATRLSQELPEAKILVIEAGPAALDEDAIDVPGLKGGNLGGKYDWKFPAVPQTALKNRTMVVNRGKVLGGSSAINLLTWDRAAAVEYDQWEKVGNPGWNWKSMSAAMTKAENYTGGPPGSGTKGPVHASVSRYVLEHPKFFVPTVAGSLGIAENNNSLQGDPIGVMFQPSSINPTNYARSYSASAYLPRAGPNLEIMTDTLVAKVNLKKKQTRTSNALY